MFLRRFVFNPLKVLLLIIVEVGFLYWMSTILDGFTIESFGAGAVYIILVLVLNYSLRPFLLRLALRFNFVVFIISIFIINALIFMVASIPFDLISLDLSSGIILALLFSIFDVLASGFFRVKRNQKDYLKIIQKNADTIFEQDQKPGFLFLEIDGLSHRVLKEALENDYAPNLKKLLDTSHSMVEWECDLSSQTSASQAGILLGNNTDIVAFRWFDRQSGKVVTSSSGEDVKRLEQQLSTHQGLLADNGVSLFNLFSGDAFVSSFTLSQFDVSTQKNWDNKTLYYYLVDPYNLPRSIVSFIAEVGNEYRNRIQQKAASITPRITRNFKYALIRGGMNIFARDVNYNGLIGKVYSGAESIYATFSGYDEVAHHSGIETHDALVTLKKIDRKFGEVFETLTSASKKYQVFILSDHGQSQGQTFKQMSGQSLDDLVRALLKDRIDVVGFTSYLEDKASLNLFLTNLDKEKDSGLIDRIAKKEIDPELKQDLADTVGAKVVVLASGNLGLIYSASSPERLTLEKMEQLFPGFVESLAAQPGIGFLMIDSQASPVVISAKGRVHLKTNQVTGENPLAQFGENASAHLLRTHSFRTCPDILVNSSYSEENKEGHAFEELVGFHGGLGGDQSKPFIIYPREYQQSFTNKIVGAENVHKTFMAVMRSSHDKVEQ